MNLLSITFRDAAIPSPQGALVIRADAANLVPTPEWVAGRPVNYPAAYVLSPVDGRTIVISVTVESPILRNLSVDVRAISFSTNAISILGPVNQTSIHLDANGRSQTTAMPLSSERSKEYGVGCYDLTWRWQYRLDANHHWTDFATSKHEIFVIIETPTLPWQQTPPLGSESQMPWVSALRYACRWASGTRNLDDAASLVASEVYKLGPSLLEYDCLGGASTYFSGIPGSEAFNCTQFIELLKGDPLASPLVNCTDCAMIVSTFANLLGCDLSQSRMGFDFALNPILAIGHNQWQPGCNWGGFHYHEVAWSNNCDEADSVFDACLEVDGDLDPTSAHPNHFPLLALGMRFGAGADFDYRWRLAAPGPLGVGRCNPRPYLSKRRRLI